MLLLVPHLFAGPRLLDAVQDLRLPGLETLLARGHVDRCPAEGVEAALCEALGVKRQHDWPLAPITLVADGGVAGDAYWLRADPVHLAVMRDHVVLAASDALDLTCDEADVLCTTIAGHFGDDFSPLPLHPQRWYLRLPDAPDVVTEPLSVAVGRNIESTQPQGSHARRFRAILNELQMLLHEHPLNLARQARGALPVSSLWLWGGGRLPAKPNSPMPIYADNVEAQAVVQFCASPARSLPPRFDSRVESAAIVVLDTLAKPGQFGDAPGWRQALIDVERDWFMPLRRRVGKIGARGVHIADPVNGKALHLTPRDARRIWKRPSPFAAALKAVSSNGRGP